jgi:hypothetical protein
LEERKDFLFFLFHHLDGGFAEQGLIALVGELQLGGNQRQPFSDFFNQDLY